MWTPAAARALLLAVVVAVIAIVGVRYAFSHSSSCKRWQDSLLDQVNDPRAFSIGGARQQWHYFLSEAKPTQPWACPEPFPDPFPDEP